MTPNIYIPAGCQTLADIKELPQRRIGIQGYGGTGKTWAALTFPNPVVANIDRGLGAHIGRADVIEVKFYDEAFCKKIMPTYTPNELKEVCLKWLSTEGYKLTADQTLIWDGNTSTQNAYHKWFSIHKYEFTTKQGKVDEFAEWREKKNYYADMLEVFKKLRCDVVFIAHEAEAKDKDGTYKGKIRPLLTGQVGDELVNHFTDFFRQFSASKPEDYSKTDEAKLKREWNMTRDEFKQMCESFKNTNAIYFWQTESDDNFDGKRSSLVGAPKFIPATFESFNKYRRQISTPVEKQPSVA